MSTTRPSRDRHAPVPFEAGQGGGLASSKDTQTTASPADGKDPGATPTPSATSTSTSSKAKKKRQVLSPEDKQAKKKIAMEAKKQMSAVADKLAAEMKETPETDTIEGRFKAIDKAAKGSEEAEAAAQASKEFDEAEAAAGASSAAAAAAPAEAAAQKETESDARSWAEQCAYNRSLAGFLD